MERNDGNSVMEDNSHHPDAGDEDSSDLSSNLVLDHVGLVILTFNSDGLAWKSVDSFLNEQDRSFCLGIPLVSRSESSIKFYDVYAAECIDWGLVYEPVLANAGGCLLGSTTEMYRFTVHSVQRSKAHPSLWTQTVYTFGHQDFMTCQTWVNRINAVLRKDADRPKSLLVFVHPRSGKGNGCRTWESLAPIFSQAKVKTKVTVTERAGQAFDFMSSITNKELNSYDGVVAVGGDGFFNEILNGLLLSRHKAPYPPSPTDCKQAINNNSNALDDDVNGNAEEPLGDEEVESPLLLSSPLDGSPVTKFNQDSEFTFPNERFRFGIIPAGSTDAIVICTTGTRDPITSALQIILGKRVCLDIAQVVRWQTTSTSKDTPLLRYAASFAGYGFYGDVITESEKYRWMGPKRYDYAGTKVFLRHSSYEAELAFVEVESEKANSASNKGSRGSKMKTLWGLVKKSERLPCRAKCVVCSNQANQEPYSQESKWLRSKGRFLSVGAAVISCRNEKAPDGLVADAHLSDGFLHLILIRDCPRAHYLW